MFTYKTKDASVSKINDGKTAGFSFCLFFFFPVLSKLTRNVRIQHKDHNRLTLEVDYCFCKVKIYLRLLILSPGDSITLE